MPTPQVARYVRLLFVALFLASALAATSAPPLVLPNGTAEATAKITAAALRAVVAEIAGDAYEGRAPGSAGDIKTRAWLQARMQALGLMPGAADGSYQQRFTMVAMKPQLPGQWSFHHGVTVRSFRALDDFVAVGGKQIANAVLRESQIVFVGYGMVAPEFSWDDYKNVDVRGKTVLVLNNDPDWDPALFAGKRRLYYGRWDYKYEEAARHGAAAAIILHTDDSAGYPWQVVRRSWSGDTFRLPAGDEPALDVRAWLTEPAVRELVALGGHDLTKLVEAAKAPTFVPVPLGVTTALTFENAVREIETGNVLARLPGSDPVLGDELVVYSAHHDHFGIGEPDTTGDRIHNGAVDNASGVATVVTIAEAFAALPTAPRRSVLFAFVAGEEQGLLGSIFYSMHPTVPTRRIAAAINFDGANVFGRTRDVAVIGRGKSTLEDLLAVAAARQNRVIVDEAFPEKGSYYRSDQFSFARVGVPSLYFRSGVDVIGKPAGWGREESERWVATHYHQPSDQLDDSWDLRGAVEDAQLGFWVGAAVAQETAMPTWRPGDEFEATRNAALQSAP
jgi:Zn-dependent M28 family amino/carboxypeptidase